VFIGVGDGGGGEPSLLEKNSNKCEIIWALNFGKDLFLEITLML